MINLKISSSYSSLSSIALQLTKDHNEDLWKYLADHHPEIAGMASFAKNDFSRTMKNIRSRLREEFILAANQFRMWWPTSQNTISEFFEIFFALKNPEQRTFYASLGISTICPRDTTKGTFIIPYLANKPEFFRICSHEISHFYFFKKMKELSREIAIPPEKDIWIISEVLVPCLLNSDRLVEFSEKVPYQCYAASNHLVEMCRQIYVDYWENQRNQRLFWQKLLQLRVTQEAQ